MEDSFGLKYSKQFTIQVVYSSGDPEVYLSNWNIEYNDPIGTLIGVISMSD